MQVRVRRRRPFERCRGPAFWPHARGRATLAIGLVTGLLAGCAAAERDIPPSASGPAAGSAAPAAIQEAFDPARGAARPIRVEQTYQAASGRPCARVWLPDTPAGRRVACRAGEQWVLVPDVMAPLGGP